VEGMSEGKFNLSTWVKGSNQSEHYERLSYVLLAVAVIFVWVGMTFGSFVKYTVYLAAFGALLLLPAIVLYIASQLIGGKHETAPVVKQ
jgi:hypothetical protein